MSLKKYDIILADPPWPYNSKRMVLEKGTSITGVDDEYNTLTMKDLCSLPIRNIRSKNCILYLWATGPKLQEAFELIDAWGFKYSTMAFVWDKRIPNPGYYSCSQCEYVLIAKKGKCPKRIKTNTRQLLTKPRTKHSIKPELVQDRIDNHWDKCEKIELFARRYRDGWDCIGDELNGTIEDFLAGVKMPLREDEVEEFENEAG